MSTTATKGARLTDDEQALLAAVTAAQGLHFRSEADALRVAALIGLRVLAVRGLLTGAMIPLRPEQLAKELSIELLPVFELLLRHDSIPTFLQTIGAPRGDVTPPAMSAQDTLAFSMTNPPARVVEPVVAPQAAAAIRAFGTSFLEDDDDDE